MEIPRNCRDCCFRAGENDCYTCGYALLTGKTRMAQPAGAGCTYKVKGQRYREDTVPKDLLTALKQKQEPPKPVKKCVLPEQQEQRKKRGCTKIREAACMELYRSGLSDAKIAADLGVSKDGVAKWRRRNGLPATNTNETKGSEYMARKNTVQKYDAEDKKMEHPKVPFAEKEQVPAQEIRDWAKQMREEKEKLQADLKKETARGDALEAENRQLKQKPSPGREAICENARPCEHAEPVMALPVLTELLGKIAQGWPTARLSGNPGACRALALHVTYGGDGKERDVEVQLLA